MQKDYVDRMTRLIAQFDSIHHAGWSKDNPRMIYGHVQAYGYRDPATLLNNITNVSMANLLALQAADPLEGVTDKWLTAKDIEQTSGVPARAVGRALASVGIYSHRKLYRGRMQRVLYVDDIKQVLNNL